MQEQIMLDSGISLATRRRGTRGKTPVLFVHGFSGRSAAFDALATVMEDRHDMLLVDLRGHGESDRPVGKTYGETLPMYTIQQFRNDLVDLIEQTGFPTPFVLLGHSMGGMIAQELVLARPDLVSHLVLASTLPTYNTPNMVELLGKFKRREVDYSEPVLRLVSGLGFTTKFAREHPDLIEDDLQHKLTIYKWTYIACIENFVHHFDVRERLKEIHVPTLVITGKRDAIIDWHYSEELAAGIPGARLVVIPKQNHFFTREVPDAIAAEIDALVS